MSRNSHSRIVFTLTILLLAIGPSRMPGQTMSFLRQLSGPGPVAADSSGIYVFGSRVRKFDTSGNELWTRKFNVPVAGGVTFGSAAADATGVYVVAYASTDGRSGSAIVRKYDAGGNELWTRQIDSVVPLYGGLAADGKSGVYVFVSGDQSIPNSSFVRKYSAGGDELWTQPGGLGRAAFGGLAADVTGVYVVGALTMIKYDAGGNELWTRSFGIGVNGATRGAATDGTGLYIVSDTGGGFGLQKFDTGGNELWTLPFAITSASGNPFGYPFLRASAVAVDATGVSVAGFLFPWQSTPLTALPGQCRSGSGGDAFVRKYDSAGAELWTREFGTPYGSIASAVAVNAGAVYVVEARGIAFFPPPDATGDAFLARFEKSAAAPESKPSILPDCVINSASYVGGAVAPGEIVTVFGSSMGPAELVPQRLTEDGRLATTLAETRILFNGAPAPLLYVSDKQSSAIVPYGVAGRLSVDVQAEYRGVRSDPITVPVLSSRPGIFTLDGSGQGQGLIRNEDGSLNSPSNPAQHGSVVTIYATGGGEADPRVGDGQILSDILPMTSLPVFVSFYDARSGEWYPGEVLYAGGVSGSVAGLLQIRLRLPLNGIGELLFSIGSQWEIFQVTMALRQ